MKGALLLRLAGPLQSWGDAPRHVHVPTRMEPTKSGVVGIICQAIGRDFTEDVSDLAALTMTVRVDREGDPLRDFHVVRGVPGAGESEAGDAAALAGIRKKMEPYYGKRGDAADPGDQYLLEEWRSTVVSYRHYLQDAHFVVALEGDVGLLERIEEGLASPARIISLGRRCCLPGRDPWVCEVFRGASGLEALTTWPWERRSKAEMLRLVIDLGLASNRGEVRRDWPLSLHPDKRRFAPRRVEMQWLEAGSLPLEAPQPTAN